MTQSKTTRRPGRGDTSPLEALLAALLHAALYLVSLLPLRVHYLCSDLVLYPLVYRMARYRVKLVRKQLLDSLPERSEAERRQVERRFYHWLCDYVVETVKLFSISRAEMSRRMRFEGMEEVRRATRQGRHVTLCLGHYCNWEWVSSLGMHVEPGTAGGQIYHELENRVVNRVLLGARSRFGVRNIRMDQTFKTLMEWDKARRPSVVGYIADQAPGFNDMHCWPLFLHHDTPVYTGPEKISRLLGCAVFYLDIERPRRGYYVGRMVRVTDNARRDDKFFTTRRFYELLEATIRERPAYWLWTHNRWKRTREQFNQRFSEEQRRHILSRP